MILFQFLLSQYVRIENVLKETFIVSEAIQILAGVIGGRGVNEMSQWLFCFMFLMLLHVESFVQHQDYPLKTHFLWNSVNNSKQIVLENLWKFWIFFFWVSHFFRMAPKFLCYIAIYIANCRALLMKS